MNKSLFILLFAFLFGGILTAQEGMWLLTQIDDLNLEEKGMKISASDTGKRSGGSSSVGHNIISTNRLKKPLSVIM